MWKRACSSQHDSLPCYVRISENTVHQPKYVVRISSSDSLSWVSSTSSEPPPIMFHSAWQTWPASCQSPGPKSLRQSTSLVSHKHTHTHTQKHTGKHNVWLEGKGFTWPAGLWALAPLHWTDIWGLCVCMCVCVCVCVCVCARACVCVCVERK